jgi:type IV pilus assembly protein PilW
MNRPTRRFPRGFSLVEMMVASGISIIVIGAAMLGFTAQNQSLQAMEMARAANNAARDALVQMEQALRRGGWGVDPRFAFDFQTDCMAAAPGCRDQTTGPDQLVFLARNPLYQWQELGSGGCATPGGCYLSGYAAPVNSLAGTTLNVTFPATPASFNLHEGQLFLATCLNGQSATLLTLDAAQTVTGGAATNLTPNAAASVPYNDTASLAACHGQAGAAVFLVDRSRFRVHTFAGGTNPWLVLDPMMDANDDGAYDEGDYVPIAKNVEDMQVAYMQKPSTVAPGSATDSDADWIIGNTGATAEEPDPALSAPNYSDPATDADRFNMHPANIRAVRITLVVRSDRTDSSQSSAWTGDSIPGSENRSGTPVAGGRFRRYVSTTEVTLRNMASSSPFVF